MPTISIVNAEAILIYLRGGFCSDRKFLVNNWEERFWYTKKVKTNFYETNLSSVNCEVCSPVSEFGVRRNRKQTSATISSVHPYFWDFSAQPFCLQVCSACVRNSQQTELQEISHSLQKQYRSLPTFQSKLRKHSEKNTNNISICSLSISHIYNISVCFFSVLCFS